MSFRVFWAGLAVLVASSGLLRAQWPGDIVAVPPSFGQVRPLPPLEPVSAVGEATVEQATFEPIPGLPPPPPIDESVVVPAAQLEPPPVEIVAEPEPPPKLWEGSFELGLNGTEGNSRTFNVRFGFDAKRKTTRDVFSLDLDYNKKSSGSVETANRAFFDWRYEWLIEDSAWTLFVHGTDDYDEFRDYDIRVSLDAGIGRKLIDTKQTSFLGRFGAGCTREFGGPKDEYVPELNFGLDLSHKISKRQKLAATVEYAPDVSDFTDCRVNSKVGWEVLLDEEANLSLKVSIRDRYDSTPGNSEPNDIDYSTVLLWSF